MVIRRDIPVTSAKKINLLNYIRIMILPLEGVNLSLDLSYLVCYTVVFFLSMTKMWHTIDSLGLYEISLGIRLSHRWLSNSPFSAYLYFRFLVSIFTW